MSMTLDSLNVVLSLSDFFHESNSDSWQLADHSLDVLQCKKVLINVFNNEFKLK